MPNGKKLKVDRQKLAKLRGLPPPDDSPLEPTDSSIVIKEFSGHREKVKSNPIQESDGKETVTVDNNADSRTRTIVVKDITKNAKGMTLLLKVNVVKKSGEEKQVEFAVDMPDFEPSCLRYGKKIAFLE